MRKLIIIALAIFSSFLIACEDELGVDTESLDKLKTASEECLEAESVYGFVISESFAAANEASKTPGIKSFPKQITLDYDLLDGIVSTGKIIISITDSILKVGAEAEVAFENFSHKGHLVSGTATIINEAVNENDKPVFEQICEFEISSEKGSVEWKTDRQFIWLEGSETKSSDDDVFSVNGNANGKSSGGTAFEVLMVESVMISNSCEYISKGVVQIEADLDAIVKKAIIDYGDGECDNKAIVTMNNEDEEIELD